jgi:hypothetical protein
MSILGNLFGGGDSESSSDFLGALDVTGSIGLDIVNESRDTDDGDSSSSWDHTHIGSDFDLSSVLGSAFDSSSDSDEGGGLLGIL